VFNYIEKNIKIAIKDLTRHLIYTAFIILISAGLTYLLTSRLIQQKSSVSTQKAGKTAVATSQTGDELYVERGSPYDNRTIDSTKTNVIFHGPRDKKRIALTFDAEMTEKMRKDLLSGKVKSSYNKTIIDILKQTNTKATLFLTGMWIELYPDATKDLSGDSLFELGSHSYTDSSYHGFCYGLKQIPSTLKIEDIGSTEKLLREHAGIDNRLFRFPGGCYNPDDVKLVNQVNDTVVHWDVVGADGFNKDANQITHNVIDNVQNGSIIVLHMNGAPTAPKTADALPAIIKTLKERGFEFVKVSELLNLPPAPKVQN